MAFENLSVTVTSDTRDFERGIENAQEATDDLSTDLTILNERVDETEDDLFDLGTTSSQTALQLRGLDRSAQSAEDSVEELGDEAEITTGRMRAFGGAANISASTLASVGTAGTAAAAGIASLGAGMGAVMGTGFVAYAEDLEGQMAQTTSETEALSIRFQEIGTQLQDIASETGEPFVDLIRDTVDEIVPFARRIRDAAGSLTEFEDALRVIGPQLAEGTEDVVENIFDTGRAVAETVTALDGLSDTGAIGFFADLNREMNEAKSFARDLGAIFGGTLLDGIGDVHDGMADTQRDLLEFAVGQERVAEAEEEAADATEVLNVGLEEHGDILKELAEGDVDGYREAWFDARHEVRLAQGAIEEFDGELEGTQQTIRNTTVGLTEASESYNTVFDSFDEIAAQSQEATDGIADVTSALTGGEWQTSEDNLEGLTGAINEFPESKLNDMVDVGGDFEQFLRDTNTPMSTMLDNLQQFNRLMRIFGGEGAQGAGTFRTANEKMDLIAEGSRNIDDDTEDANSELQTMIDRMTNIDGTTANATVDVDVDTGDVPDSITIDLPSGGEGGLEEGTGGTGGGDTGDGNGDTGDDETPPDRGGGSLPIGGGVTSGPQSGSASARTLSSSPGNRSQPTRANTRAIENAVERGMTRAARQMEIPIEVDGKKLADTVNEFNDFYNDGRGGSNL